MRTIFLLSARITRLFYFTERVDMYTRRLESYSPQCRYDSANKKWNEQKWTVLTKMLIYLEKVRRKNSWDCTMNRPSERAVIRRVATCWTVKYIIIRQRVSHAGSPHHSVTREKDIVFIVSHKNISTCVLVILTRHTDTDTGSDSSWHDTIEKGCSTWEHINLRL